MKILIDFDKVKATADLLSFQTDRVIVREKVNGKWGSYALSDLPPKRAVWHAVRLLLQQVHAVAGSEVRHG